MIFLLNHTLKLQVQFLRACLFFLQLEVKIIAALFTTRSDIHAHTFLSAYEQPLLDKVCVQHVSDTSGEKVQSVADRY